MTRVTKHDEFRIREKKGTFIVQQKVTVFKKKLFSRKIEQFNKWCNPHSDAMIVLGGIGCFMGGEFKTKEQARSGVDLAREHQGFKKPEVKYHNVK